MVGAEVEWMTSGNPYRSGWGQSGLCLHATRWRGWNGRASVHTRAQICSLGHVLLSEQPFFLRVLLADCYLRGKSRLPLPEGLEGESGWHCTK